MNGRSHTTNTEIVYAWMTTVVSCHCNVINEWTESHNKHRAVYAWMTTGIVRVIALYSPHHKTLLPLDSECVTKRTNAL